MLTLAAGLNSVPLRERQAVSSGRAGHDVAWAAFEAAVGVNRHVFGYPSVFLVVGIHECVIAGRVVEQQVQVAVFANRHAVVRHRELRTRLD